MLLPANMVGSLVTWKMAFVPFGGLSGEPVYRKGDVLTVPATFSHSLEAVGLLIAHRAKELPLEPRGSLRHLIHL